MVAEIKASHFQQRNGNIRAYYPHSDKLVIIELNGEVIFRRNFSNLEISSIKRYYGLER